MKGMFFTIAVVTCGQILLPALWMTIINFMWEKILASSSVVSSFTQNGTHRRLSCLKKN